MKKMLAILMVAALFIGIMPIASAAEVLETGKCGPNATYTITSDGVMTISGTGKTSDWYEWIGIGAGMATYSGEINPPWMVKNDEKRHSIKKIIVDEGITSIGKGFFRDLAAQEIILPSTLVYIDDAAFYGCQVLKNLIIPDSVEYIGANIFALTRIKSITLPRSLKKLVEPAFLSSRIEDVYFYGTEKELRDIVEWIPNNEGKYSYQFIPVYKLNDRYVTVHYLEDNKDTPSNWATDEVNTAISLGLVPADLQKNYRQAISRENIAKMFVNLLEKSSGKTVGEIMTEEKVSINQNAFSDTKNEVILAANALGILRGVGGDKFDGNGLLTRAQIAAVINRIAHIMRVETEGFTHSFTDVRGHWVESELGWPVHRNIIRGVGDNKFDPNSQLTTEQAIAIVYRAYQSLH